MFGDNFRSKDLGGLGKTVWVLFVILIPWLGILVYLIVRGKGMQERQLEQMRDVQRAQNEYIKSVAGGASTGAWAAGGTPGRRGSRYRLRRADSHPVAPHIKLVRERPDDCRHDAVGTG